MFTRELVHPLWGYGRHHEEAAYDGLVRETFSFKPLPFQGLRPKGASVSTKARRGLIPGSVEEVSPLASPPRASGHYSPAP